MPQNPLAINSLNLTDIVLENDIDRVFEVVR